MGSLCFQKPGLSWWRHSSVGREQSRRKEPFCRAALPGREHAEDVHAAQWPDPARPDVPHAHALRDVLFPGGSKHGGNGVDRADRCRLQDEAGVPDPRRLAHDPKFLLQRLVEHSRLQTDERLLEI